MGWKPLRQRHNPTTDWEILHEGVPPWLFPTLIDWLANFFWTHDYLLESFCDKEKLHEVEIKLHLDPHLNWAHNGNSAWEDLIQRASGDGELLLEVVDLVLSGLTDPHSNSAVGSVLVALDGMLRSAGSAWRVAGGTGNGDFCLERRVPTATVNAAHEVVVNSGRAGQHLANAWSKIYSRDQSASEAYREAVRAVEVAAIPIVSPQNNRSTLGTIIADMKNAPDKWRVTLFSREETAIGKAVGMLELLWQGQTDRHGTTDESTPLHVAIPEAQAAVHLATTLVQWFTDGVIVRR